MKFYKLTVLKSNFRHLNKQQMLEFYILNSHFSFCKNPNVTKKFIKSSDRRHLSDFRIWRSLARLCRLCRARSFNWPRLLASSLSPSLWGIFLFLSPPPSYPESPCCLTPILLSSSYLFSFFPSSSCPALYALSLFILRAYLNLSFLCLCPLAELPHILSFAFCLLHRSCQIFLTSLFFLSLSHFISLFTPSPLKPPHPSTLSFIFLPLFTSSFLLPLSWTSSPSSSLDSPRST